MQIREIMQAAPVIPVITIDHVDQAVPLARALTAGGLRVLEVTLRTAAGLPAIKAMAEQVPDAIVGAGTVTRPEEFQAVKEAGAAFVVSPGLTTSLVEAASESGLPFLPGVMTPSEILYARSAGLSALKLFPAQQAGGVKMLKALGGPLPDVVFCPTGGVTVDNMNEFLALDNVLCVGGTWVASPQLMAAGNWDQITELASAACKQAGL